MWCDFVHSHWPLHLQAARQPWTFDDIKFLKSVWQGFVVHGRDHAPFEAHVYCPRFFHSVLVATFGESVYRRLTFSISQTQQYLAKMSSRPWLKQYKWGISPTASQPASYLLLKRKKAFAIARPIISYKGFIFSQLFRALSFVLEMLCQSVLPSAFGNDSMPQA